MLDVMYKVPSMEDADSVTITRETVTDKKPAQIRQDMCIRDSVHIDHSQNGQHHHQEHQNKDAEIAHVVKW